MYAFLAGKHSRSESIRTVQAYARMLTQFFGQVGMTPDNVRSADVVAWSHGISLSGGAPSSCTIGARAACISGFYRFLIRLGTLRINPCDALERPNRAAGHGPRLQRQRVPETSSTSCPTTPPAGATRRSS